jgi:DNA-binding MarR family transcriptional regulator
MCKGLSCDVVKKGDWRDDDLVASWSALLRLHAKLVPVIDDELQRATGVPLGWYDVLLELANAADRRMRMSDLGEAVVLSRTRVSRVVDDLSRIGYVTRTPNPDDGRSAYATLTDDGATAFRRAAPIYLARIREHLSSRLTDREAAQLRRLLDKALERREERRRL